MLRKSYSYHNSCYSSTPQPNDKEVKSTDVEASNPWKNYPLFNPPHLARLSRYRYENCMAYALNHNLEGPDFYPLTRKKYQDTNKALDFVVESLNTHFEDKELIIIAPNEKGKLPQILENYYLISFLISYANEELNQAYDYHF